MSLQFYAHPFSSYCQKVLTALYENQTPFEFCLVAHDDVEAWRRLEALWTMKQFPVLVDQGKTVVESSVIIEHLDLYYPGPAPLIPKDPKAALPVRMMDRFFDNYVMTPMQKLVYDHMREEGAHDLQGVAEAKQKLDKAYAWLNTALAGCEWATGNSFTLADCAAAPALFYADWSYAIPPENTSLIAYRQRLLTRPSFARAVEEARPYRKNFPLGAPNRD
ncbi:glutathione S-transferase family protein [Hahella sp. HN01]|uniref:glutathione S-transferase family protein n=1 Tax=Hahella sp. HN01 TaxID=2847262 RepID=UPI001C1ED6A8|nr:glutathione S-transferase family protein [Hahella sp. HN01]MBU6954657.1 glutathione S-transferase family protein [Hahella sp. HN01]